MVCFHLVSVLDASTLEIPLALVQTLCYKPVKWFRYVGWAILFTEDGYITRSPDPGSQPVLDDDPLSETDHLYYHAPGVIDLSCIVDLDIVHPNSVRTPTAHRTHRFVDKVRSRDGTCVLSDVPSGAAQACHLIPFARGSGWMAQIAHVRQFPVEDIDDACNGILLLNSIHFYMHALRVAFLHTPNNFLNCDDIPYNPYIPVDDHRPSTLSTISQRYTIHHLKVVTKDLEVLHSAPNNADARFANASPESRLPHPSILHYIYGLAILYHFATDETRTVWSQANVWDRPNASVSPDTTPTDPGVESFQGAADPRADFAWNFMLTLTQRQYNLQEQERLRRQRVEINDWLTDCARQS
ncbi:hypothetical protein ONZ45_g9786 [Pleurotus djamor]|nr:hypothetical protein ONZ45_g9786 [Pleurotus djamor]